MPEDRSDSPPAHRPSLAARVLGRGGRGASAAARATGIDDVVDAAAEEAIVRALESEAVKRAIERVVERAVEDGAVDRALQNEALERALAEALDSEMVDRLWERVLASDEAQKLVERIADAPEIRGAIASQGIGIVQDLGLQIARVTAHLDAAAERVARALVRRPRRTEPTARIGLFTRALAFAVDAGLLNLAFGATATIAALIFGSGNGVEGSALAFGAGAWLVGISLYLLFFWTLAGQTPGMRLLGIRLEPAGGDHRLGFRQAVARLAGLALSTAAFGLGFAAILISDRRRGWQDRIARTDVVRDERLLLAPWTGGPR